jgi:hypothetical protein
LKPGARLPDPEERRKLFRRMEWVFVYAPPLLIVLVGGSAATLVSWFLPVWGLGFWTRWLIAFVLIIGLPLIAYLIRGWIQR